MMYDVTIGIPAYNVADLIGRTLESALSQTFPNIEFLLVDDGSSDQTLHHLQQIKANHDRGKDLRIIIHNQNQGPSAARNTIIDEAQGKYLYFMDADDIIESDTISLMMDNLRKYDAEIVFGSYEKIDKVEGKEVRTLYQYPDVQFLNKDELAEFAYRRYAGIQASACNFLVKTSILRDNNLRFFNSNYWEDMVFTLDLVTYIKRAVMLSKVTYRYLSRPDSLTKRLYHERIDSEELKRNFAIIEYLKNGSERLKEKSYYPNRCYVAVMTDFYIICNLIKKRELVSPPISNVYLKNYLRHPATLSEIICFHQYRLQNLFLWILWKMPASWGIALIRIIGKKKGLI